MRDRRDRQSGMAMIVAITTGTFLIVLSYLSLQRTLEEKVVRADQQIAFTARQIAESGAAHALARVKEAGIAMPHSGRSVAPEWVDFAGGAYYYSTSYNAAQEVSVIRAWGRVASDPAAAASSEAPDSPSWDGAGWVVQGVEITVKGYKYIPEAPLYFGNGGIERPMGGFEWTDDSDPADRRTWGRVTLDPASFQASSVPFESSVPSVSKAVVGIREI